ncbi:hypothetical protein HDU97_002162 [Phlyctochytrium planicorne]|nr:hypothetical protein HDU97_002162 [Phlyctochytrium planicorne]
MDTMPTASADAPPPLMQITFNKMRQDLLEKPAKSQYLTGWDNPRLASLFPSLGFAAAMIVIDGGDPPEEFKTITKLEKHYRDLELRYRTLFVSDRSNPILDDPYLMLEKIWGDGMTVKYPKQHCSGVENYMYIVFNDAAKMAPKTVMVPSLGAFKTNWDTLTQGMFKHVNFDNIFVAGGAVVAALQPSVKKAEKENYFNSDIDVFIYGLSMDQAREKVIEIYEAIRRATTGDSNYTSATEPTEQNSHDVHFHEFKDSDILCVRNLRSLIFVGQYPKRQIQIVFRLYKSPAEILMGFDIDSCCFGYDGKAVYGLPRGIRAMTRRYNKVDMTRRSASYEYRLFKYAKRGFAVMVPRVIPRNIKQANQVTVGSGFARLLSLQAQQLVTDYHKKKFLFDNNKPKKDQGEIIQADRKVESVAFSTEEKGDVSHYQVCKIPYGKKWPLKRIASFVSSFSQKATMCFNYGPLEVSQHKIEVTNKELLDERGQVSQDLHRMASKPMVYTVNCIRPNLDRYIPQYLPDKIKLFTFEESWMTENPGEQLLTGSFQPVKTSWEEWFKDAYSDRKLLNPTLDPRFNAALVFGSDDDDYDGGKKKTKKRRLG